MKLSQKEIEAKLTKLQDEDRTNPEIYELLVLLTGNMLKSQNWLLSDIDFDNVTHDVAAELFMKVSNGTYTIKFWRAMAYRLIKFTYVKKQRKIAMTQIFDTKNDPIRKEILYNSCASYINENQKQMSIAENKAYLLNIPQIIDDVLKNSKFDNSHKYYNSLHMSIILSLLYNKDVFFHIPNSYNTYVHILTQQVKFKIANSGIFDTSRDYDIICQSDFENALMPNLEFLGLLD